MAEINAKKVILKNENGEYLIPYVETPFVSYNNITNCILEAPHRINIELKDGVLTLKKGSVVIVPNGVGKFDEVVINADITIGNIAASGDYLLFTNMGGSGIAFRPVSNCYSGTSDSGTLGTNYYNTSTNIITSHNTGGDSQITFPFARVTFVAGTGVTSIDQVFNGMGYIGSTIWRANLKYLIPNGRNADGSLNNIEVTTTNILTYTMGSTVNTGGDGRILLNTSGGFFARVGSYDTENNYILGANGVDRLIGCVIADNCTITNGVIKQIEFKYPFRAVDYYDVYTKNDVYTKTESDSRYVNATGDTMSGRLAISGFTESNAIQVSTAEVNRSTINTQNTAYDNTSTTAPSAHTYIQRYRAFDKNGKEVGCFETVHDTSNNVRSIVRTSRIINGVTKTANFNIGVRANGNRYTHFDIDEFVINGKQLVSVIAPNYNAGVAILNDTNYTAPSAGWVIFCQRADNVDSAKYWINGREYEGIRESGNSQVAQSTSIFLDKGDIFKAQNCTLMTFYPCKGV